MERLLEDLLDLAQAAAQEILDVYRRPFDVTYKRPRDPVTEADHRANALICAALKQRYPALPVVAEESPEADWADYRNHERVFFVDPLDGTREFVKRSDQFVVMIGLLDGDRPSHGVLYVPVTGDAYVGSRETGAFHIAPSGERRRLAVTPGVELARARLASSRGAPESLLEKAISTLDAAEVEPIHSAGLKAAAVAAARADVYLAPESAGCRWDSCAAEAILEAAGGRYTNALGQALDYRTPRLENSEGIIAAAPALHEVVIDRLKPLVTRAV